MACPAPLKLDHLLLSNIHGKDNYFGTKGEFQMKMLFGCSVAENMLAARKKWLSRVFSSDIQTEIWSWMQGYLTQSIRCQMSDVR